MLEADIALNGVSVSLLFSGACSSLDFAFEVVSHGDSVNEAFGIRVVSYRNSVRPAFEGLTLCGRCFVVDSVARIVRGSPLL